MQLLLSEQPFDPFDSYICHKDGIATARFLVDTL